MVKFSSFKPNQFIEF